jgi:hypothetical protein
MKPVDFRRLIYTLSFKGKDLYEETALLKVLFIFYVLYLGVSSKQNLVIRFLPLGEHVVSQLYFTKELIST